MATSMAEALTSVFRMREVEYPSGQISYSVANGSPPLQHLRK